MRQLIGIILGFIAVSVPTLWGWEMGHAPPLTIAFAIAGMGGAVGGRILVPPGERMRAHAVAIAGGAIAGIGSYEAMAWWLHGRESTMTAMLILVALIGALPGVVLGQVLFARVRRPDERVPKATARAPGPPSS